MKNYTFDWSEFKGSLQWGKTKSFNDVDLDKKYPIESSAIYCTRKIEES